MVEVERLFAATTEKVLGHEHPDTLDALYNLHISLLGLERYEEAIEIGKRVVAGRGKVLGHEHLDTIAAIQRLDIIFTGAGGCVRVSESKSAIDRFRWKGGNTQKSYRHIRQYGSTLVYCRGVRRRSCKSKYFLEIK